LKRRWGLLCGAYLDLLDDTAVIACGGAKFLNLKDSMDRAIQLWIIAYDIMTPEPHRRKMRKSFRELLAEHPLVDELYPGLRRRLNEHEMWVQSGFDELDPDEIEGTA
jgi:hypothetical protein